MVLPLLDFVRRGGCPSWPPESGTPVDDILQFLNINILLHEVRYTVLWWTQEVSTYLHTAHVPWPLQYLCMSREERWTSDKLCHAVHANRGSRQQSPYSVRCGIPKHGELHMRAAPADRRSPVAVLASRAGRDGRDGGCWYGWDGSRWKRPSVPPRQMRRPATGGQRRQQRQAATTVLRIRHDWNVDERRQCKTGQRAKLSSWGQGRCRIRGICTDM